MADVPLARNAPTIDVYINGEISPPIDVLQITRSTGGAMGDVCLLRTTEPEVLQKTALWIEPQTVEVRRRVEQEEGSGEESQDEILFWGQTSGANVTIDREALVFEARLARFHFGQALDGMIERTDDGAYTINQRNVVFNPWVRGKAFCNMDRTEHGGTKCYTFYDEASVQLETSARARGYISDEGTGSHVWTLPEAVLYLCERCNPGEQYIKNPTREDLQKPFKGVGGEDDPDNPPPTGFEPGGDILRGVEIEMGLFLNEALDRLLTPFGYGWYVEPLKERRELRFFKRGDGERKQVLLQEPGEQLDLTKTELVEASMSTGLQSLVNEVRVLGALRELEVEVRLYPAWTEAQESSVADETELAKSAPGFDTVSRVRRDYVLNEAFDYTHIPKADLTQIFDRDDGEPPPNPKRKRFWPCLLLQGDDGAPRGEQGYELEVQLQDGDDWAPVSSIEHGSWGVLQHECGIRFDGEFPPPRLYAVRIRAVIQDDLRVEGYARKQDTSVQTAVVPALIVDERRFQRRIVGHAAHPVARGLIGLSLEIDDTREIAAFAERMRATYDQADNQATLTISGLDLRRYKLGQCITGISGRKFTFETKRSGADEKGSERPDPADDPHQRFPQIVAITWDFQRQRRTLTLETFRDVVLGFDPERRERRRGA